MQIVPIHIKDKSQMLLLFFDQWQKGTDEHLTSGVWKVGGVFILCRAMKQMREFVSGEPRTPMLDLRLAFNCARRDFSWARWRECAFSN